MSDAVIPAKALEGLMKKVFIDKKMETGLFWDALLKAKLFIPLANPDKKSDHSHIEHESKQLPIQLGQDSAGKKVLWVFTSPEIMFEYTEQHFSHIDLIGLDMFGKLKEIEYEVVLIGPDKLTLSLDPKFISSLAEGKIPAPSEGKFQNVPKDAKVQVGKPVDDTKALEKKFTTLFKDHKEVKEACFIQIADDNGSRLLLGLALEKESRDHLKKVAGLIAKAAEGVLAPGKTIDVTLISGSLKGAFKKWGKSFYKS